MSEAPRNTVIQGHVLDVLGSFPDNCVDVVVTSTPYWGLRDYGKQNIIVWGGDCRCEHVWGNEIIIQQRGSIQGETCQVGNQIRGVQKTHIDSGSFCSKCGAWRGQLGLEPHPQMFIDHLTQVFSEAQRVLKKNGSLWLNLGDTFYTKSGSNFKGSNENYTKQALKVNIAAGNQVRELFKSNWLQSKQKLMIPARVAIALQEQGWILRNEIVWHKINHMPESVNDRLTRSWESVYFFTKNRKYYFNLDKIRKPIKKSTLERCSRPFYNNKGEEFAGYGLSSQQNYAAKVKSYNGKFDGYGEKSEQYGSPRARTQRKIDATAPFFIQKGSGGNINLPAENPQGANPGDVWSLTTEPFKGAHFATFPKKLIRRILKCACPKGGLVLDPFCGSGTALLVAHKMGFDWVGIDLNPEYVKMADNRILAHGKVRLDGFLENQITVRVEKEK